MKDNRSDIIKYIDSWNDEFESAKTKKRIQNSFSIVFFILACISFVVFPCFSGTDYHDMATIGTFLISPLLIIIAIVLRHESKKHFVFDSRDSLRQMIEGKYGHPLQLEWHSFYLVLKKYEIEPPSSELVL